MARFVRAALAVAIVSTSFWFIAAPPPASGTSGAVTGAVAWLRTQQQPDGGFELAGGFLNETMDAVNALAQGAQTTDVWSAAAARAAVLGTSTNAGKTPLDFLDNLAEVSITKGQAAKLIVLVTNPLGLDPTAFDPSGDGAPRNLVTTLGGPDDVGSDHKFGIPLASLVDITFAIRAYAITNGSVPATTTQVIRDAQQGTNGGWFYNGDNSGTEIDFDSTSNAVRALLAAGISVADTDVDQGLDFLELEQESSGAWQFFGSDDPNSTSQAVLALAGAGRTSSLGAADSFLSGAQIADGRIASPSDAYPPINTFATSQTIQALVRAATPVATSFVTPTTVPAATGGGALSLETSVGTLTDVSASDPATLPAPPAGASFPRGLVSFRITGLTTGATATVRLVLPVGTSVARYFKFNGSVWSDATSLAAFAGNVVTLTLTDGGAGDEDGVANGIIVDPGGPSVAAAANPAANPAAISVVPRFAG